MPISNDDTITATSSIITDIDRPLSNSEIIEHAMQYDMPIFVSIDGGLKNGIATVCMTILGPDILQHDADMEWQDQPAKALLIRSWQLPALWGTSSTCINMAEALGFIIGKYTIPGDLPVIYITDSNNARTSQRNVKNKKEFTHPKFVRNVKQGIEYSIANHLEYLTSKWPRIDQLSLQTREAYERGEFLCKQWAKQQSFPDTSPDKESDHDSGSILNNDSSLAPRDDDTSLTTPVAAVTSLYPTTLCYQPPPRIAITSTIQ